MSEPGIAASASAHAREVAAFTFDPRVDPSPRFVAAFEAAAVRMRGLSFVNPALAVEALGFAPWEGHWLGVLVTPWCMNLVLAPREPHAWQPLARGDKRTFRFPAGNYEFVGAHDPLAGEHATCSLFSPVLEFADQETARFVAVHARGALLDAANAEDALGDKPRPQALAPLAAPLSKREFLRGRFLGTPRDRG